eukprot:m.990470 g.990470  ORF g.990470 m.990470 type:complete len:76 (-) comp24000_c1_seq34:2694-2921(-)
MNPVPTHRISVTCHHPCHLGVRVNGLNCDGAVVASSTSNVHATFLVIQQMQRRGHVYIIAPVKTSPLELWVVWYL